MKNNNTFVLPILNKIKKMKNLKNRTKKILITCRIYKDLWCLSVVYMKNKNDKIYK